MAKISLPFVLAALSGIARRITNLPRVGGLLKSLCRLVAEVHLPDDQVISLRPFSDDPYVVNEIYNRHAYDHCNGLKAGCVVIDVGAQIGVFALRTARIVGASGLVLAIEPEPENFGLLSVNSRRNGGAPISAYEMALGSYVGKCWLLVRSDWHTAAHRTRWQDPGERLDAKDPGALLVRCSTLDSLARDAHLSHIDLIKIDVEGSELAVLEGASGCIRKFRPRIVLESHPRESQLEDVTRWLRHAGYSVHENEALPLMLCAEPEEGRGPADRLS